MKKTVAILVTLVMLLSLTSCGNVKMPEPGMLAFTNRDMNKYNETLTEIENASEYMPTLDELDGYSDISFSYQHTVMFIYESHSIALFAEYPDSKYEDKKTQVLDSYEFLEKTILSENGETYQSAPAKFDYDEYTFRTVASSSDGINSPFYMCKSFAFIGFNDNKNRIAFCYFYDFDLDTMGSIEQTEQEMITEFINDFFDWNDLP